MTLPEFRDLLSARECKPTGNGTLSAKCPAHDDGTASLSVSEGNDGRILLHCHAGCSNESICGALGLEMSNLFPDKPRTGNGQSKSRIVATYPYRDEAGALLFEVVRFEPKDFRQRAPDGHGGWAWSTKGIRRVLYRLPELLVAVKAGKPVFIAEGEKDVAALVAAGFDATCNPGGAGKWLPEFARFFEGAVAVIVPDRDESGRKHAQQVAANLHGKAAGIQLLELPAELSGYPVKDAHNFFAAGGTAAGLFKLAQGAPVWTPATPPPESNPTPADDAPVVRPWLDIAPDAAAAADAVLIGPGHWLTRGSGLLIVGATGCGKSTLDATLGFSFALGREAVGLRPSRPLRSLVIQAEDDDLDLQEMRRGIIGTLNPTAAEVELLRANLLLITERARTGQEFIAMLPTLLETHRPDLLHVNPLSAYFGNDLNDQHAVAAFFRNGLNPILARFRVALVTVHHCAKPSKERDAWKDGAAAYLGSGSADLANWAREVLTLRQTAPGLYELTATKRWRKLGWLDADGRPTASRLIAHGKDGSQVWRDATGDVLSDLGATPYTAAGLCGMVAAEGIDKAELLRAVIEKFSVSDRTAKNYVADACRMRLHSIDGQRLKAALLVAKDRPRKEVYPDQPANRPVVWMTLSDEGRALCKR